MLDIYSSETNCWSCLSLVNPGQRITLKVDNTHNLDVYSHIYQQWLVAVAGLWHWKLILICGFKSSDWTWHGVFNLKRKRQFREHPVDIKPHMYYYVSKHKMRIIIVWFKTMSLAQRNWWTKVSIVHSFKSLNWFLGLEHELWLPILAKLSCKESDMGISFDATIHSSIYIKQKCLSVCHTFFPWWRHWFCHIFSSTSGLERYWWAFCVKSPSWNASSLICCCSYL